MKPYIFLSIFYFTLIGCGKSEQSEQLNIDTDSISVIEVINFPSESESSVPNLYKSKTKEIYLTWIESFDKNQSVLKLSKLKNNIWQTPSIIAEGDDWIVNWADFPSITSFGENSLAVNYLIETNPETFAYDIKIKISNDNGKTWDKPFPPHSDNTLTEHGFVSLLEFQKKSFLSVWLDGRKFDNGINEMSLRSAIINTQGEIEQEYTLDDRICDCCSTDAIDFDDGIAVVYRDRDENEIRDISIVYFKDMEWSKPKTIANDNWEIAGCPVNGPAIDALGGQLAVAWFTQVNDTPTVRLTYSENASTFSIPIKINSMIPIGRVDLAFIDTNSVAISWIEGDTTSTYVMVRYAKTDGSLELGKPVIVSKINENRSSGFPIMIKNEGKLLFAWTKAGAKLSVNTVSLAISKLMKD